MSTSPDEPSSPLGWLRRIIIGGARSVNDTEIFHKLSLIAFFAWVGLGADGLSSSCYGPSEAFARLGEHTYLAIFVAMGTAFTVVVISSCYSQVIERFPTGGGGYLVASQLLNPVLGMVSGCALLIDYTMTISLSIAAGADAVFSFIPMEYHSLKIWAAIGGVVLLTTLNMRGVRESVMPLVPIFLIFILTHIFAVLYALVINAGHFGVLAQNTANQVHTVSSEMGVGGLLIILLRAYSLGAGTYTGIEAVSNGLPMLREPRVQTGKRTMLYMASSLVFMVVGLMLAYLLCDVREVAGKTLNAVFLETISGSWGASASYAFLIITLVSEAAILFVAAQAGFFGGPRVLANMALDRWFPSKFAMLSDRLVTQNGVLLMGGTALVMLIFSRGSVAYLMVLYSITVFITFVLATLGMVRYWWQVRGQDARWKRGLVINGLGLLLTSFILVSVAIIKFREGGWITLVVTGSLVTLALLIRRHYNHTYKLLKRLDMLVSATEGAAGLASPIKPDSLPEPACSPEGKTAVVLVNGFNGLGLHTLFSIIRMFGDSFKNYAFVQVGIVDAGNFKGSDEIGHLEKHVQGELDRYVHFMKAQGHYAERFYVLGTDIVDEVNALAPKIQERFPNSVFFGGQIVFPEETLWTRWLHNYIVFAVQRKLYSRGIPFMVLPIRV